MSKQQAWDADRALTLIKERESLPGALLPILHALQDEFGYIDKAAIPLIADALNLSHAEVHGVDQFLSRFSPQSGREACAEDVPRRSLPVDGLRQHDPSTSKSSSEFKLGRDHGRRQFHAWMRSIALEIARFLRR